MPIKYQWATSVVSIGVIFAVCPFKMALTVVVLQLVCGGILGAAVFFLGHKSVS